MKKVVSILLSAALLSVVLAGCSNESKTESQDSAKTGVSSESSGGEENNEKIELTYWTTNNRKTWTEEAIAAFKELYPNVTITATYDLTDALRKNLKIGAASKTLPSMWYNYGGNYYSFFVENDLSYDLTGYAAENQWAEKMDNGLLDMCTYKGEVGGYPQVLTTFGAIYRKDIFEKYGIQPPATFEEFEGVLKTLKSNGITPLAIGGKNGWHLMRLTDLFLEMYAGPELHDQLNSFEASWDQEAVVKAFAKLKEWNDAGYLPEGFVTSDPNDARLLLYNGVAAITIDGAPIVQMIQNNGVSIDLFSSFRIPNNETPNRLPSYVTMMQYNANLSDKELEAAIAFTEFTMDQEAAFKDKGAYPLPYKGLEFPEENPLIVPIQEEFFKYGGFTTGDNALVPEIASAFYQADESVIGGSMTPEEAARFLQQNIEAYKAQNP